MQLIETGNWYSPLQSEENPTDNGRTRTDSPDTKVTAKQNSVNTTTQNVQSSNNIKWYKGRRKFPVTAIIGNSMVKDMKDWKMSSCTRKFVVKHFSSVKTKDMKYYIIPTV